MSYKDEHKSDLDQRSKKRSYSEKYFDPRADQLGLNAGYHTSGNKSDRTTEEDRVVEPTNMNPSGTVKRKGRGAN